MTIKAECAWGFGDDVLIGAEGREVITRGNWASIGCTAAEARHLAAELLVAAERAEELDKGYFEAIRNPPKDPSSPT